LIARLVKISALGAALASTLIAGSAQACTNPAGQRGQIVYNADYRTMQYCTTSGWIAMGEPGSAATGCTDPVAPPGTILYNQDDHVAQFCAGSQWSAMGPVPGAGGAGCTNPAASEGQMLFNDDYDVLQYCDGSHWVGIGKAQVVPADVTGGLLAWYPLDDGAGSTAADSAPTPHNGTLVNGPTWTSGMVGGALSFNGTNSYVDIAFVPAFDLTGDLTLSAWIDAAATDGIRRIIALPRGATGGLEQYAVMLNSGALQFWLGGSSGNDTFISTPYSTTGAWHFVAATVSGSFMSLYVDGVPAVTGSFSGSASRVGHVDGNLAIGRFSDTYPQVFSGAIDDVRLYGRALSDAEIHQLYLATGGQ
jgi:hypothetical protein